MIVLFVGLFIPVITKMSAGMIVLFVCLFIPVITKNVWRYDCLVCMFIHPS